MHGIGRLCSPSRSRRAIKGPSSATRNVETSSLCRLLQSYTCPTGFEDSNWSIAVRHQVTTRRGATVKMHLKSVAAVPLRRLSAGVPKPTLHYEIRTRYLRCEAAQAALHALFSALATVTLLPAALPSIDAPHYLKLPSNMSTSRNGESAERS